MILPSRRALIGIAASGILLPTRAWGAETSRVTPVVPPFAKEGRDVRDTRFGEGTGADGRAILSLASGRRRIWLDMQATSNGDGRSAASPYRTEFQAYGAMRGGDQLMIASGSVLDQPLLAIAMLSGRDAANPTVFQSYDRAAPDDEARYGLFANQVTYKGTEPFIRAQGRSQVSCIALRGICFDHRAAREWTGYDFTSGISWLLIEQCAFLAAQLDLNAVRDTEAHVVRQTAFQGQWSAKGHAQGLYTSGNYDTVVEDCVFHHCGWKMDVDRSAAESDGGPTIFNHGLYAQVQSGGILRRCAFIEPSSHGAQLRGNWASHDNVFIACPLGLLHGGGTTYATNAPDGVMALAYRNIFTLAEDISPALPRGSGLVVANTREGSVVEQNLAVAPRSRRTMEGFGALAQSGQGYEPNKTTILFRHNTNAWSPGGFDSAPRRPGLAERILITDRDNIAMDDKVAFTDPSRDGLTAARSLGFATVRDFGNGAALDPAKPWATMVTDHIRPGYAPRGMRGGAVKGAVRPDGSWNG
jgi:hypothetical protein